MTQEDKSIIIAVTFIVLWGTLLWVTRGHWLVYAR